MTTKPHPKTVQTQTGLWWPSGQGIGSWQACHDFDPSTTEEPPCKGAMHVKFVDSLNVLPCGILEKKIFKWHFLEKAKKQDLVWLAEELGQKVSDKMTNIELRNIIIGSKDYEEEFVRDQLSVILEERFERESEEKIARQLAIEEEKIARQHAIQQLRWESELNELRLEIESIRSNVKRTSCAEDRKKTSSNYRISIGRAEEHVKRLLLC
ncbi:hypothetical protein TNCV_1036011 [Trichonephila clavipes]|nr:hypothetical protein TNCV_1036011 [Trichonephila clavipes]